MKNKKICPKIDIEFGGLNVLYKHIDDRMEIHLLDMNIKKIRRQLSVLIENVFSIKELVLHLPGCCLNIEDIFENETKNNQFNDLLNMCNSLSKETGVTFEVLAHCGWLSSSSSDNDFLIKKLKELSNTLKDYGLVLLLENTIDVNKENDYDKASYIVSKVRSKNIKLCIDLSHLKAVCNRLKLDKAGYLNYYRYLKPSKTEQIHVSSSVNGDGYINMSTHGVKHYNLKHLKDDFELLELLGIADKYLVPEVMEYKNKYKNRKCELKEIELINSL